MSIACMTPGCGRIRSVRYLCLTCYSQYVELIRKKKTTWEQLEKEGKCKPTRRNKNWGSTGTNKPFVRET